ncbi:uncharacterized protein (TIGR02246 family) [Methylohalomonas lacus]|uniref:Uncharacterized protein (TIGR02246 family) n=1 Tax=Methylohalomonas lacus TaxID=398773 RepID=A0AAE3HMW0_9GAMM|nr:SgcJ/EcaC family oxidoreductase [Methylohalomonas lacus]MCS3904064.1 uncharacterized protein (TIGR02246 family) [Methylohalomonas lacus]
MIRKQLNRLLTAMLAAAALLAVAPVYADDARETAAQLNSAWDAAFNRQDASALAKLYDAQAIVSPGNGETLQGRDDIAGLFQGFFDNGLHDHSIEVIAAHRDGDSLNQVARWQAHGAASDGGERPVYGGILSSHFHRGDDGEWSLRSHVWNMRQ